MLLPHFASGLLSVSAKGIGELVARNLADARDLVELGAGYGYNLFALSLALPERRFIGLDIPRPVSPPHVL